MILLSDVIFNLNQLLGIAVGVVFRSAFEILTIRKIICSNLCEKFFKAGTNLYLCRGMKRPPSHYRLDFISENTFTRVWSIRFTRARVIVAAVVSAAALCALLFVILRFTPVGRLLPGSLEPDTKARIVQMALQLDSLESVVESERRYAENLVAIMMGEATGTDKDNPDSIAPSPYSQLTPEQADSMVAPSSRETEFLKKQQ